MFLLNLPTALPDRHVESHLQRWKPICTKNLTKDLLWTSSLRRKQSLLLTWIHSSCTALDFPMASTTTIGCNKHNRTAMIRSTRLWFGMPCLRNKLAWAKQENRHKQNSKMEWTCSGLCEAILNPFLNKIYLSLIRQVILEQRLTLLIDQESSEIQLTVSISTDTQLRRRVPFKVKLCWVEIISMLWPLEILYPYFKKASYSHVKTSAKQN